MKPRYEIDKASLPQGLEWLKTLPKSLEAGLAKTGKVMEARPNQVLGKKGETLNYLIAILSGSINLYSHSAAENRNLVATKGEGTMIGWMSVIDEKPLEVDIVSQSDSRLLLIPVHLAKEALLNCKDLTSRILLELTKAIREFTAEKQVLSVPNAHQRVYVHLLHLFNEVNAGSPSKIPKQEEIAKQINTSRETVSRALQILIRNGIILKRGHQIEIKNLNGLKKIADAPHDGHSIMPAAENV